MSSINPNIGDAWSSLLASPSVIKYLSIIQLSTAEGDFVSAKAQSLRIESVYDWLLACVITTHKQASKGVENDDNSHTCVDNQVTWGLHFKLIPHTFETFILAKIFCETRRKPHPVKLYG